jgi:WD40 repeat protein
MSHGLWYAHVNGQELGPISAQELLCMVREGTVRRDTLVRQNPSDEWTRAANIEGLFPDSSLSLPTHPVRHSSIPVSDGRDRLPDRKARIWLWIGVALASLFLIAVWAAVARRIGVEQRRRQVAEVIQAQAERAEAKAALARPGDAIGQYRQEIRSFVGHTDIVKAVAFSPDGRYLLSGGGSINFQRDRVAATTEKEASSPKPTSPGGEDNLPSTEVEEHTGESSVRVWDVNTGKQLKSLPGHLDMVGAVAFSPDGSRAITADIAGLAILWDTRSWRKLQTFHGLQRERYGLGETRSIEAVAFSPDGRLGVLAGWGYDEGRSSANYDKNPHLILWDLASGEETTRAGENDSRRSYFDRPVFVDALHSAAYTHDGAYIIAGASGSNAGMYYYSKSGAVYRAVGSTAPKARVLNRDLRDPDKFVYEIEDRNFGSSGHDSPSASFVATAISPDSQRAVSADTLSRLCLWGFHPDPKKPELGVDRIAQIDLSDRPVRCLAYSPIGQYFATGGDDLLLWHGARNELEVAWELGPRATGTFAAKPFHVHSLAFSPDGKYIAAGCDDHLIRLWKVP